MEVYVVPYLIILLASITHFAESVMYKKSNTKTPNGGFLFISMVSLAAMLFTMCMYLFTDGSKADFTPEVIPYGIVAGIFYCVSCLLTYLVMGCGPFAISMLILSYSIVITSGYGIIFLNEPTSPMMFVAFAAIALSLYLVRGDSSKEKKSEDGKEGEFSLKWLIYISLNLITTALYGIVLREQQIRFSNTVDNECMMISFGTSALVLLVAGIIQSKRETGKIFCACAPYALAAGAANGATNLLSMLLNTMMALSISSPTRSVVKTAITFIYSYYVLKERYLPRQIIGVVIGVAAVVLLNFV